MQCSECSFENPRGMKFCGRCGRPLALVCPGCGAENPAGFSFCGQCATRLTPSTRAPVSADRPRAERRHLTVMFCDLVDSTFLSSQLDPEDLRRVVCDYQQVCSDVVQRYEGHVAQFLGDGVLVYFGYPAAHEDGSRRAVHAALDILEAMAELRDRFSAPAGYRLAVRIGIHYGLVVIGEVGGQEASESLALGDTPNVAARVQGLAEPDTVLITSAVHGLVARYFHCRSTGAHRLKGVSEPVTAYQVLGEKADPGHQAAASELAPLVGRVSERQRLLELWERVRTGVGQGVMLVGEAGIGKSRLVEETHRKVTGGRHPVLECNGSSYHQNTALYPVIELLRRTLGLSRDDSPESNRRRLEREFETLSLPSTALSPVASLLSLPLPDHHPPLDADPRKRKEDLLEALLGWILGRAGAPLLLTIEDLHWIDPSTLELLDLLIEHLPRVPILLLLTARPGFDPRWSEITRILLERLEAGQAESLVASVSAGHSLPSAVVREIVAKTDGVPLFVEELTKTVLEAGRTAAGESEYDLAGPVRKMAIPSTLHDSLMARLDRLSSIKGTAQLAAVVGREVSFELLQALSPLDDDALEGELARLVDAELLVRRGTPPRATYTFRHALIRDVAYESLLRSTRRKYHELITRVLEERFTDIVKTQPELLAHHSTAAGLIDRAMAYWRQASELAIQKSANIEAIRHLSRELELLSTREEDAARIEQELSLQLALGPALMNVKGWSAPEVEQAYRRARELSGRIGDTSRTFGVLRGLWGFFFVRGELETARDLGEDLVDLAEQIGDGSPLLEAHRALGAALFPRGELSQARQHLERALEIYDPEEHRSHVFRYGQDPGVTGRSFASLTLWLLGLPEQAEAESRKAVRLARQTAHLFSLAFAESMAAMLHFLRRDAKAAGRAAAAALQVSTDSAFAVSLAWGTIYQGWALAESGETERGIEQMITGLERYRNAGAELARSFYLAPLIDTYVKNGRADDALGLLDEALTRADAAEERFYEAELHRLQGEVLLSRGSGDEAEVRYRKALEVAGCCGARSLELRAAVSLARLLAERGRAEEGRTRLAEIYGRFSEGFSTPDLKEAAALLS